MPCSVLQAPGTAGGWGMPLYAVRHYKPRPTPGNRKRMRPKAPRTAGGCRLPFLCSPRTAGGCRVPFYKPPRTAGGCRCMPFSSPPVPPLYAVCRFCVPPRTAGGCRPPFNPQSQIRNPQCLTPPPARSVIPSAVEGSRLASVAFRIPSSALCPPPSLFFLPASFDIITQASFGGFAR